MRCSDLDAVSAPYVDGETPSDQRAPIERHLALCPPCRQRLEAECAARDALRANRDRLCETAPADLRLRCRRAALESHAALDLDGPHRRTWRRIPLTLVAAALLVFAFVWAGRLDAGTSVLAAQATLDHWKCNKFNSARESGSPETLAERWRKTAGWPIVVPDVRTLGDLRLRGIRRCATSEGQTAHLMYTYQGRPISLFIARDDSARTAREYGLFGHETIVWSSDHRTYLLVGDEPRDRMQAIAASIRKETLTE